MAAASFSTAWLHLISARLEAPAAAWLRDALVRAGHDRDGLLIAYTAAGARLPKRPLLSAAAADDPLLRTTDIALSAWRLVDGVRLALLLARAEQVDADTFAADALACYEQGDASEQESWLRALPLLPQPERFLTSAIDACRTNILPLFQAIACDNPYPARLFPELSFNQLVMKSLFNGVPLARVVGLAERRNAELSRMAADYSAERRAAGRTIPGDIGLAAPGAAVEA